MPLLVSGKPREKVCFVFQQPFWAGSKTAYLKDMFQGDVRVWDLAETRNGNLGQIVPIYIPSSLHLSPSISHRLVLSPS